MDVAKSLSTVADTRPLTKVSRTMAPMKAAPFQQQRGSTVVPTRARNVSLDVYEARVANKSQKTSACIGLKNMWKKRLYVWYDSSHESDSGHRVSIGDWARLPLPGRGGNVMDFDSQHWLDYDIVALVVLVLAITLLELTVLGILGLTSPQLW